MVIAGDEAISSVGKASISAAKCCAVDGAGERGTARWLSEGKAMPDRL